jgi:hypothetical protein
MPYKQASRASPKLAAKYEKPEIDEETLVITNGAKLQLECELYSTTDVSKWDEYNKTIKALFGSIKFPVYHTLSKEHTDMGYDHKGRRAPYVESIDLYVWSVSEDKKPIVHLYEVDPSQKSYFLRQTYTQKDEICCLTIEDYDEDDKTFLEVYRRIVDYANGF